MATANEHTPISQSTPVRMGLVAMLLPLAVYVGWMWRWQTDQDRESERLDGRVALAEETLQEMTDLARSNQQMLRLMQQRVEWLERQQP